VSRDASFLRDEIALREASLLDAQREFDAGELTDDAFAAINTREHVAMTRASEELERLARESDRSPAKRRVRRRRLLVVSALCFAVAIGVLLWSSLSPRQAGNSITGSVSLGHQQEIQQLLTEAQADIANANPVAALSAYQHVLALDAKNVEALTQTGWLDFSAGSKDQIVSLIKLGVKDLRQAVTLGPTQAGPRLYYAIVADSTPGNTKVAKEEFEAFLKLNPSRGQLDVAQPFLKKLGLKS
jgi:cytochrome c-type biogenesis protein CcmH/NrfG